MHPAILWLGQWQLQSPIRRRPRVRPILALDLPRRVRELDLPAERRNGSLCDVQAARIIHLLPALWSHAEAVEVNGLHAEALTVRAVVYVLVGVAHTVMSSRLKTGACP